MKETGSIKFHCNWIKAAPLPYPVIAELNRWRDKLYHLALIGENADGIGYGNISMRYNGRHFIITGSGTGKIPLLDQSHYTTVTAYQLQLNSVTTEGPVIASSESMTHAVIYDALPEIHCVMHVHYDALWKKLMQANPYTSVHVEYGTPAMAAEIQLLLTDQRILQAKIFAMGGHEEGVIAFGETIEATGRIMVNACNSLA